MAVDFILNYKNKGKSSSLITEIDKKIAYISDMAANKLRLGLTTKINYELYEDLVFYRLVLEEKLCGSTCFQKYSLERITSKIKTLLNKIC